MKIVVTGGLGYIGSWVVRTFLDAGHDVGIIDDRRSAVTQPYAILDRNVIIAPIESGLAQKFLQKFVPDVVLHLAASTNVGEGERKPFEFIENNVGALATFLKNVIASECHRIVQTSSCTVYGIPRSLPVKESDPLGAISWYGWTKLAAEEILRRACDQRLLRSVLLRCFNPVGPSLGTLPEGLLVPRAIQAASSGSSFTVNGKNYATKDGTCVRDYVDVRDVAEAHLAAAEWLMRSEGSPCEAINVGSGRAESVLEILRLVEKISSITMKIGFGPDRPGDVPGLFGDVSKAASVLGWNPKRGIEESIGDAWNSISRVNETS